MARPEKRAFPLIVFLALFFAVWTLRATWLYAIDESIPSPQARMAYATAVKILLWVLPAMVFAYTVRKANPLEYLGLSLFPGLGSWLLLAAVTGGFLSLVSLFELTVGRKSFSLSVLPSLAGISGLLFILVSPLAEEILFRGLVMKELMRLLPLSWSNILTALIFTGIHLPFWLSHGGPTAGLPAVAFGVFLFSLLAGWLFARSASAWPPFLAHVANNLLATMLVTGGV